MNDITPYTGWRLLGAWLAFFAVSWAAALGLGYALWRWPAATLVGLIVMYALYSVHMRLRLP